MNENKTINEYMKDGRLKLGDFLYSYLLGYINKYKFVKIVKSEYDDEQYALLKPISSKSYDSKQWVMLHGFENEHTYLRANIKWDVRFNVDETDCLNSAIKSLELHIKSSQSQLEKAKKLLAKS